MKFKTLSDYSLRDKRVLVRVDFNVPMEQGIISDESRIEAVLPTLRYLQEQGARLILMSHLGRPKGQKESQFSLKPLVRVLKRLLPGTSVSFLEETVGDQVERDSHALKAGDILLLENLRFHKQEEENDKDFAKKLAKLGDLYVNDAFSASHRAHASIDEVTHFLPACAGLLLDSELKQLEKFLTHPKEPMMAILGGAKISSKLALIEHLIPKLDTLLIGGAMVGTLLEAQGIFIGDSLSEPSLRKEALSLLEKVKEKKCKLVLSRDVVVVKNKDSGEEQRITSVHDIREKEMIVDVGPETVELFKETLMGAKTVVWNGPLGRIEVEPFDRGTRQIAEFLAHQKDMITVCGGGDTVSILNKLGVIEKFSYVSMAGGAFLEWLEGRSLPGLKAL
ncbi:MAG TPA: phosphoglycerate kinase, partial [Holosporales bacterium]|nr:phosphoglycerate kinase [Holosporales bacterium]